MSAFSIRVKLEKYVIDSLRRDDLFFYEGHDSERVGGIRGPDVSGPFATDEQLCRVVNHALAFSKRVLMLYDLGDNIPPIAVTEGARPIGNGRCDEHFRTAAMCEATCVGCRRAKDGDDSTVKYVLDGYSFKTLGEAIVFALALRDRENANDARYTAQCIQRVLKGAE